VDSFGADIKSFISSQKSLSTFCLTKCKGYTRIFFPALSSHKSSLRQLTFNQVDFKGCDTLELLNSCKSLESLVFYQCSNIEEGMIKPLVTYLQEQKTFLNKNENTRKNTKEKKIFADNFQVRYINLNCTEFDKWCKEVNDIHNNCNDTVDSNRENISCLNNYYDND